MSDDDLVGPGIAGGIPVGGVIPRLLASCPSLTVPWKAHLDDWDGDERGNFNDAAVAAHLLVELLEAHDLQQLQRGLATIEDLLVGGDQEARAMLIVGVIEDVQTISSNRGLDLAEFSPFLGPETAAAWDRVLQYWQGIGARSLADVVRAEHGLPASSPAVDVSQISDPSLRRLVEGLIRPGPGEPPKAL